MPMHMQSVDPCQRNSLCIISRSKSQDLVDDPSTGYMLSGEVSESASSSSATYYGSCLNMNSDVAERITSLLSSLRLTSLHNNIPQDGEDERLKKIHRQLEWLISEESDDHRRRRLRNILPAANCVREQVFALRRYLHDHNTASSANYATYIHGALTAIMKESFEEEYRKLATVVGVLDAVAELLIFEVDAFDIDCPVENRTIRKLIASTLTNLTFGNTQSKRRLCSHPNLIEYTIRIIDDSHGLAQIYAGLLRNLSWMADAQMSTTLAPSVPALVRASLRAYRTAESKCLCATLSALWNLASHSRDNKKALCEEPGFLEMLIELSTNDAQHTALVEPATGVLKYASMYLAVVGADQYLSTSAIHMMMLRLIDLLNSPSFTVIGNALGILSQLLAKGNQLRSHILLNHKAMLLLNHLRNSTRDDIRNPVKTVLNYLNSFDVSEVYVATSPHPSTHGTPPLSYRFDGMSSSYDGTASVAPSYIDSTRLLKYRSPHSYTASILAGKMSSTLNSEYFPYSSPSCASIMQQGFAPRPGDRSHHQEQPASLPRQFFQKSKISNASSVGDDSMYLKQTQPAARFSPSHPIHPEQKDMSTSTMITSGFAIETSQGPNLSNGVNGDDDGLKVLNRPDDPSFEVEDSVRCTRCTSTQSLSSLFPGERSTWNSCNNSAADSNRLSPVSATEIPDSPTQYSRLTDLTTLSARDFNIITSTEKNETRDKVSTSKEVLLGDPELKVVKSSNGGSGPISKDDRNTKGITEQGNSLDDDYGSFMGRADSELLNQSIESAMPKRVEINEEFLADMIEQAQPKPSPLKQHEICGGRNFSRASTARASSVKIENDDFLLQSIASVLPQSSNSTHDMSSIGSPPKKARAMTGDTARTSGGPKRVSHAVLSNSHSRLMHSCSVLRTRELRPNGVNLKTMFGNKITGSNSAALFDAALRSSFVESPKTTEKVRDASDASLLVHQGTNEESDTLSEDNYSPLMDNDLAVDKSMPQDIDEESQTEQLIIDCGVVSRTVRQTVVKPVQKASHAQVSTSSRFGLAQKNMEKRLSRQEIFTLPAPLSNCNSRNSSPCNPILTSAPTSFKSMTKFPVKTPKHNAPISKSTQEEVFISNTVTSRIRNSCVAAAKSSEDCKDWSPHHARLWLGPTGSKQSVLTRARPIATPCSSSSKINVPRPSTCRHRAATSDTSKIPQNCASSIYETIEPQAVLIQELAKSQSAKILPLSHKNVNEKVAAITAMLENDSKRDTVVTETGNGSETQCNDHSTSERKKTIKQMLVTTV
ncbi:hypothetical protein LOAG_06213 [Loa loa]|uniref:Adenomatous polyposis coli protein n=1 Tax=Loa loa TaxID=7209 RepID=A0A1I7W0D7_LOALO|nr:hypothetical protein LOAG_06213 [Loa loa]EFO22271.2 hypothetical protein LOAG_06213 [Loa loa]